MNKIASRAHIAPSRLFMYTTFLVKVNGARYPTAQRAPLSPTDFTKLNQVVKREIHPMATVENSIAQLSKGKLLTKLDANSGFWQIKLSPKSRLLTTFLTAQGRFCYNRLPFGLSSSPEIFEREMSAILEGLPGVVLHMYDVLI